MLAVSAFVPLLQPGDTVPAVPLIDQTGKAFSLGDLRGNAVVLSFIYTRCADPRMCPLVSSKFAQLQRLTAGERVRLVEITLDPAYDSPRVLRSYGAAFRADPRSWTLATGAPGTIAELAERFGIATQWTAPGTLVHTEAVAILDPGGSLAQIIDGNTWSASDVRSLALGTQGALSLPARARVWLDAAIEACGGGRGGISGGAGLAILAATIALAGAIVVGPLRRRRAK